jgi:hypothetical protein
MVAPNQTSPKTIIHIFNPSTPMNNQMTNTQSSQYAITFIIASPTNNGACHQNLLADFNLKAMLTPKPLPKLGLVVQPKASTQAPPSFALRPKPCFALLI